MKYLLTLIALFVLSFPVHSEINSGNREVLLDNGKVEVVRLSYPVGSESGMHSHKYPSRVVYVLKGGVIESIPEDKQKAPKVIKAV